MSVLDAFVMPKQVTIIARTSSITNSFVNGIIPCLIPTENEVAEALSILGMNKDTVACAYCGDPMTEWDHLNPLVKNKRPTGFISEIKNLVPSCSKCNQSKGNKPWREWIVSGAKKSPRSKNVPDLEERIARLEEYEQVFEPIRLDFESIVDTELWSTHWANLERIHNVMQQCQAHSDLVKHAIADSATRLVESTKHHERVSDQQNTESSMTFSGLHEKPQPTTKSFPAKKKAADIRLPDDLGGIDALVNQRFAMRCIEYLKTHSKGLESDLAILCSKDGCKAAFNHDQALLKLLDGTIGQAEAREDSNGYPRYYKAPVMIKGQRFLVSKEWYGLGEGDRDNRTPFLEWLLSRI